MEEEEIPLFQIGEIILPARGVSVSVELLADAAERGISVAFLGPSGKPYALLSSPMLTATVSTRREQLRAMDDARGAEVCRRIVAGKLRNQAGLLTYFAKALGEGDGSRRERVLKAAGSLREARREAMRVRGGSAGAVRETLMGMEGAAGRVYWEGVSALCEGHAHFEGRRREGDIGPVNALLNYGYGILYSRVWGVALNAGLDPFAGFLHTDRPGKPSLVLDLVEELRAPVVDRPVLAYLRLGRRVRFDGKQLAEDTRRALAEAVLERLESPVPYAGRRLRLSSVIQAQARSLATFLRGESRWRPFTMYW
jgi:CRISPR-associated protein Cas1